MMHTTLTTVLAACALASAQITMTIWLNDGTKTAWTVSETDRVPLDSQALTWQQKSIPLSQVRKITFSPLTAVAEGGTHGIASAPMFGESLDVPRRAGLPAEIVTLDGRVVNVVGDRIVASGKCSFEKQLVLGGLPAGLYLLRSRLPGQEHRLTPILWEGKR